MQSMGEALGGGKQGPTLYIMAWASSLQPRLGSGSQSWRVGVTGMNSWEPVL